MSRHSAIARCLPVIALLTTLHHHAATADTPQAAASLTSSTSASGTTAAGEVDFRFTKQSYNVTIPENSVAKTYATQPPGADRMGIRLQRPDALQDVRFKIVDGDRDRFFKAEDRLVGDFCFLFIRTRTGNNDVLNRERKDKYVLQVRASGTSKRNDNGKNGGGQQKVTFTTDATVVVTILDTDDLNPLFYPMEYNATVFEDTPVHQGIVKVVAEDADLGRNGEIYYSFAEETDKFAIHPMTGVVSLSRPLRYNEGTYHELTVIGQDRGTLSKPSSSSPFGSRAKIRIRVRKVNFHAPEIRVRRHPQIVENSNADIYAIVNVSDKDSGIHGEIKSLEIVDGDPDGHFRIRPTKQKGEFNIEVLKLLDRESTPQGYTLQLRAVDCGIPPRESYKSVPVHLTDLNDNSPVFNKEIYEIIVSESAPVNTPLIRLKVTDADEGKNAQVFLEIVGGNEGGEFTINAETGMLYTAVPLDAEAKQFYSLTVSAIDQGNAGTRKQSSAKVKIYVEDTNDNDPIFDRAEMTVWIDENMPSGTSVTTVHARDKDRGENAYISYLIMNINKVPFDIDHFSGVLKTTSLLDYESMRREYVLRLRASDWGLPYRRQTEMQLTVKVKDINDNRPQFEKVDCVGHVVRSVPIGSEIITLSAIDFDAGNIISYRIVSGNEDGCFSIDATSGTITVSCDLNDIRVGEREINVTATDGTHFADIARVHFKLITSKRTQTTILNPETGTFDCKDTGVARRLTEVLAAAENNNKPPTEEEFPMMPTRYGQNVKSPEYIDFPAEIKVNESVALGTTLVKLKARDRDLGYNGKLIYGISGGDKHSQFCVDMETGELKVIGYLDRERESEYFLNITVYDLGKPQKSASRMLPITVLDVNDNEPVFEKSLASFRVTENALNGTSIFRANATDADSGDNAKVTYSLITDTNDFAVDKTSGVLYVSNPLDRERQDLYELRIRATDAGGKGPDNPPLHSEAVVRVSVDDINDNAPKFSLPSYSVKIREDIPKGSVVAVVTASDPDLGLDGEVLYSLEDSDSDGTFKIDKLSGTIRTTKMLDFEERQVHSLMVFANDRGNPSLSSETSVTVHVVDVNENMHAPVFSDFVLVGKVAENLPIGAVVMQVNATDADPPGGDSNIEYSIRGGDGIGVFSIDNQGFIKTLAVLDIESKSHYWLTVFAQDRGVVPLFSSVEVYIEVLNENDNVPLSDEAVYYPSILEDSPAGSSVLQIRATDKDKDPNQKITYRITSGNPEGFFSINSSTGLITTTSRKLDRETGKDEHILEVLISDNGEPPLSSTTRVAVKVEDINDNSPEFEQISYSVQIPANANFDQPMFQNDAPTDDFDGADVALDDDLWESHNGPADFAGLDRVFRVLAYDRDAGKNAELHYSIKSGKGRSKFKIDNSTGMVYAQKGFEPGQEYELNIKATDSGNTSKSSICKVSVRVVAVPLKSKHAPVFTRTPQQPVKLTEGDEIGFLVALIQAHDKDNDTLWYDIVDGDPRNDFYIARDTGNILLAHKLDFEMQNEYSLNISVTDSVHTAYTMLNVSVVDINDHRPEFSESLYKVEISEAVPVDTEILKLRATDRDDDGKLIYALYSARSLISLQTFKIDSITGAISLASGLDRESLDEHLLTVMVRDGGTPAKRNYARVKVIVHDHNDHVPHFSEQILVGKVFESAALGSQVLRAFAVDHDKGDNARLTYSIISGNVGNVFAIDPDLGIVSVARELDLSVASEYMLRIKATDHGQPALSSSVPAHIMLTMADNAPPRFIRKEIAAEIFEDQPLGSYVAHLNVRSTSSLQYEIIGGNTDSAFIISPSTGVITTQKYLDYETNKFYNLTVIATNMASASATCNVIIHILDKNDNVPRFIQANYSGVINEAAPINSLILTNTSEPLVIKAFDADSEMNALLHYDIIDVLPRRYFQIDSNTGAIRTIRLLDHETYAKFTFHVQVSDLGNPKLTSETTARVDISVTDVNDCPPRFSSSVYNVTLLLPTYKNVAVIQMNASDPDSSEGTSLRFDIIEGNKQGVFAIGSRSGLITVIQPEHMKPSYKLHVRVSDGKFSSVAKVFIRVEESDNSGLVFQKPLYEGSIIENSTKITTVCVVNVLGSALNEHIEFKILNPTSMFAIGLTSGVVRTTGNKFDREVQDKYELIIEARSHYNNRDKPRVAHVIVKVTILDINDNCPMFVNLPYYAVVSVDDEKGSVIAKVHAIDLDSAENGEVRYELIKGHGELFKVQRESGDIEIKQNLEGHNREYELLIAAYDKGITPCRTDVTVHVKVIDRSMPVFKKQFYSEIVPENVELHSPLSISIEAESPLSRKLIYSIVKGNDLEEFTLDFNTGVISVVDELDFEQQQQYELLIRATDSVSGVYAEVPVSIVLQDVNDCPPEFTQESYNVSISEAAQFGTPVLTVVANDNDTGINRKVVYSIEKDGSNSSELFYIDENDGTIYLKQALDHEEASSHHFIVLAKDSGVPSLSSTAHVWLTVLDMNDNPPKFEQASYSCGLFVNANRDQFVTIVKASDPDEVDQNNLRYTIVAGNEQQTFTMNPSTGIITLTNLANFGNENTVVLNVSVSDGVYTNFARLKVELLPANLHSPEFDDVIVDVGVPENHQAGYSVAQVKAIDKDFGEFGSVTYSIHSDLLGETFAIDKNSGKITTRVRLDREKTKLYEIPVMATDGGGKSGFLTVRVKVQDENDNAPKFLLREYQGSIYFNHSVSIPFMRVKAVDADDGVNAKVEYKIYERKSSEVVELFTINPENGDLSLMSDATSYVGQVFQFFVRASDKGMPERHSDVPVNIMVMGPTDFPPVFERKDDKFFQSENSPAGTVITKLKMASNVSVSFQIVSDSDENPQFEIDNQGQITLAKPLDFEYEESHVIGVLALTDSSPPLTALAEVTLKVLDENDHAPQFESSPYILYLAENTPEGTSILKVAAHDEDQAANKEVRYSFGSDLGDLINVFAIDAHTGWISTLVKLDKETKSEYKFYVTATDNGIPKHSARTTVIIRLKDYNDSPTVFKKAFYESAVNEDALPGTVILALDVSDADADLTTPVEFYIVSGDPSSQFQMRQTGEIYVAKALDRESVPHYDLKIIVTDGMFTDTTNVSITILDANDNPPYCLKYRYRQVLSEGIQPGSFVLSVLATDIDGPEHSKLRYILSGDGMDNFLLDKDSGHLKTVTYLDREKQSKYTLTAHVHDKDRINWACSSQIELLISDLNDNAPLFSLPYYSVALPEDVEVGTLVTKIHATDADIGINRKIKYAFIDSFNNHFKMASDSGIVTLAKPLDREIRALYNLTIQAVDQGTPQLSSMSTLIVNVQDINDNPPEFANKYYYATVPEINGVGTEILKVLATSKDTGVNADVYYSIIGGNEHKKFAINNKTGVISIVEMLDYERAKDYFLTIQAIDGGDPPLSNVATVNVTVTDCNDNAPIFNQASYSARIKEDAQVGDKILQVLATDLDSDKNGQVTYSIIRGDNEQFEIDPESGYVSVAEELDRETVSSYVLEVLAKDNGVPVLSRQVNVNIEISDANDNPPLFSQSNYTLVVQEDKPIGFPIEKFTITDADTNPNTSPYTFDFRIGNEGNSFRLEQDGILRTATKFNHKIRDNYLLQIRVFDNGSPPLFSDAWVVIKVIEESQYPPIITPLEININSYLDEYPGGIIGKVYANDQDQYDTLTYSLSPTLGIAYPTHELFQINRTDGTLTALPRLDVGDYRLNVSVTDGKFFSHSIVKINIEVIAEDMLENSVAIRFRQVSPEVFVLSHRKGFVRAVRNAMNCRLKDVVIISVQASNDEELNLRAKRYVVSKDLDVLFTVRRPDEGFYTSEAIRKALNDNLEELEESSKLVVEEIIRLKCSNTYCTFGICQDRYVLEAAKIDPVSTDVTSFVSPQHRQKLECMCKDGYGGEKCDTIVNECAREPCPPYKLCIPDASTVGYSCQCAEGFAGPTCDVDISKCHDQNCYIARNPISFSGKSYSQYRIINKKSIEDQLSLSLRIRTVQPTGNLMYAAGKVDYNILEIVNGGVQYRFELGSGEGIVRESSIYVADGRWHEIKLERDRNSAKITIDGTHTAQGSAPGISDILNLQSDEMYLGAEVHQHPSILGFEDVQKGFTGCMDDIRIARMSVPLHKSGDSSAVVLKRFNNVEFSCEANSVLVPPGPCGSQPCMNGGTCKETQNNGYECACHARFSGTLCEFDADPCASAPCLYGGKCTSNLAGDYSCDCMFRLTGKRCEYGRYCSPNPCKHGGVCEEGDDRPLCKCRLFSGEFCEYDLNECDSNPCLNGGTCINEIGGFHCICPPNTTGTYCSSPLYATSFTALFTNLTWTMIGVVAGVIIAFVFVLICGCVCCYRTKRARRRRNVMVNNENIKDNIVLNSTRPHEMSEFKRGSKLSNLEVNQREVPPCPPRPLSYTPSSQNDPLYNCNAATVMLNNLDTLRSYGSAGDELENVPPDYVRNLNRSNPQGGMGNHCDSEKSTWASSLADKAKVKNGVAEYKMSSPVNCDVPNRLYGGRSNTVNYIKANGVVCSDDDQRSVGSYHWDCSDWARHSQTLPNITEVPGSEIPDSSSFHSNESNESRCNHHLPPVLGPLDPHRDIETLNEDVESEFMADSNHPSISPSLNALDSGNEEFRFTTADSYIRHPNSYLPSHGYNIPSESEGECLQSPGGDSDDVEPYGFPSNRSRRKNRNDDDIGSVITTLEERHSLLGDYANSNSDLSTHMVCDIEDSECETEQKPLNYLSGVQQTSV